jgi:hypothetical protein
MISRQSPRKRRGLFILASVLILAGVATLYVRPHDFLFRTLAVVAFVASARVVRIAVQSRSGSFGGQTADSKETKRPEPLLWTVSIAMLVLAGFSSFFLYRDALDGYHEAWPLKVFAVVAVGCALVWSYLAYKLAR